MKRLPRPRTWIALLAAIAAGLVVWMLPPLPDWRVATPKGAVLHALAPGGRHFVTYRLDEQDQRIIEVWSRADAAEPIALKVPIKADWQTRFSPDGKTLVFLANGVDAPLAELKWFDLVSGDLVKSQHLPADAVLFSPEGTLHYVKDNVVYRFDDGREICRLPKEMEGFKGGSFNPSLDEHVIYSKDGNERYDVLVYNVLLGKEVARMSIPGSFMHVAAVSRDGQVIYAEGWSPGSSPWRMADNHVVVDSDGVIRPVLRSRGHYFRALSPNGELVTTYAPTERAEWLKKWWPLKDGDTTFHLTDWRSGVEQARFRNIVHLEFSPDNEHLAVMRSDSVVEGYAWPFRPPWGLLVAAMAGSAGAVWSIGWLWTRWRERRLRVGGVA